MIKCKLSDICTINPKDKVDDMLMKVSFVPMQGVSEDGVIDTSDIRIAAEVSRGFTSFMNGDVLMAKITPCMENGKGAVVTGLFNNRGFGSTEFFVIRPDQSKARSQWIYYYTTQKQFRLDCERNMTGSAGQKRVPKSYLENREILLPTLNEQDLAVQSLNQVKSIINMRKRQLQKLDELVKARFVEMFGDSEFNTMQWPTKRLSELCNVGSSKRIYQNELSTEGIPFLRISDLNERIDNIENAPELFIPINRYNKLNENGLVPTAGDILVTSRGTLGRCYIVRLEDEFYFQDGMISWLSDFNNQITSLYLSQLFAMSGIQKQIANLQAGSTVAYLSISMLKKLNIMLPPLDLQTQFAAFVEQVNKAKAAVPKALDEAQLLFDSLMQKYFG